MIKTLIRKGLGRLGYELRPLPERSSPSASLACMARLGLRPSTLLDVGAAKGEFTRLACRLWPGLRPVMIEPLAEFDDRLAAVAADFPSALRIAAAAGAAEGEVTFNVHDDLFGSSLLHEEEGAAVDGAPRKVRLTTLDGVAAAHGLDGPFLVKVDVQGAELEVMRGATGLLPRCQAVLMEVSFLRFLQNGVLADEVVAAMRGWGFVPYDILGLAYRPLDGALAQADIVFVPEDSPLRRDHRYALPDQRAAITRRLAGCR